MCCCKDCTKREIACHDKCNDYKEWKEGERKKKIWLATKNARYAKRTHNINKIYGDTETKERYGVYRR